MSDFDKKNKIYSIFEDLDYEIREELKILEELCNSKRTRKQFLNSAQMSMEVIKQIVTEYEKKLAKELEV